VCVWGGVVYTVLHVERVVERVCALGRGVAWEGGGRDEQLSGPEFKLGNFVGGRPVAIVCCKHTELVMHEQYA
jgi:hypothetical protein